jgi:DNA-binding response OmpR family regulator
MLVDDDETIVETLEYNLKRHGYDVVAFNNGTRALQKLDETAPALVILDWMLPDLVGPEICKLIRSRSLDLPILMLTGRSTPMDVATGLRSGADDYLSKPFSPIELLARVQALLRRAGRKSDQMTGMKLDLAGISLDDDAKTVTKNGADVDLSPKEFALLKVLMRNAGKTLSTETLLNEVWGRENSGSTYALAPAKNRKRCEKSGDPPNSPSFWLSLQFA